MELGVLRPLRSVFGVRFNVCFSRRRRIKHLLLCHDQVEEALLRLLRLARIGCTKIFDAQLQAVGR